MSINSGIQSTDTLNVLAVDDDPTQLELLSAIIGTMEYPKINLYTAESGRKGMKFIETKSIDIVLTDFRLPDETGLDVLKKIKALNPLISVVVITAFENAREAVDILKAGADDYLIKPTRNNDIKRLLTVVHERMIYHREENVIRRRIEDSFDTTDLVFKSRTMMKILQDASLSADSDATVLITGESGTGKELIARHIHKKSRRSTGPFTAVNISALPESLIESELFGHRKGSFTGASEERIGRFEESSGGTVFIDEIGDISQPLQVKLLRVIQFGEVQRVGENNPRKLNVRIIAATNRNLEELVRKKEFRSDFYYRLNVIPIRIPPLRSRKEDIPALVDHFIKRFSVKNGRSVPEISREAMDTIMRKPFPGNVRELENLIEHAVVMCRGEIITLRHLPEPNPEDEYFCDPGDTGSSYEESMRKYETSLIERALQGCGGNQSEAARALYISERHLRSRMEKLDIQNTWR